MQFGAAYIRVSTENQDEYSPEAQKRLILDYAKKHDIVINKEHIFEDIGISGTKAEKRAAFQKMIALAKSKEHPFDLILVWKFSRFARNQEESILYKSLLNRSNVSVVSVSEPIIDGPFGSLIERILEWMDEYYSIRLSGEVKRGMMQKALNGGYNGKIPFGYVMGSQKIPIPEPTQAEIVKQIFDLYVNQKESISNIALILNNTGYRTASGNQFERRIIHYILENPFYIGKIRWNYAPRARGKQKDGEVVIREGKHEPIISLSSFDQAQKRIKHSYETFHGSVRRVPSATAKHWLSGILKCVHCGASLAFCNGSNNKYFQCWRFNKGTCGKSSYINAKKAELYVLDGLKQLLLSDSIMYKKIPAKNYTADESLLTERLKDIEKKEERIKLAYMDGIDSLEEYKENKTLLEKQKAKLKKQLSPPKPVPTKNSDSAILDNIRNVIKILESNSDTTKKAEAIRSICSQITFDKTNDLMIFDLFIIE